MTKQEATDYHPLAGIRRRDRQRPGSVYVQVYGYTAGRPVWCGAHHLDAKRLVRELWRLEMEWRRWRQWYDNLPANRRRGYPAKEGPRQADMLVSHPIDNPAVRTVLRVR